MCPFDPPSDLEADRARVIALWHEHEALKKAYAQAQQEKEKLAALLAAAQHKKAAETKRRYGKGSERRPHPETAASDTPPAKPEPDAPAPGHGPRAQPQIEERTVRHTLDEADQVCPSCGGELREWEGQVEEATEIDVEERVYVRKRHQRQKYRCRCGACIETALGPEKLLPGGQYSLAFAITVAIDKYADHSPLERQVRSMQRLGLRIDSQTLWDQTHALSRLLLPTCEAIRTYVLSAPWIGVDETTWRLLGQAKSEDKAGLWYVWMAHRPDAAIYRIDEGRGREQAVQLLGDYQGVVVCDGYSAYTALAKRNPRITLAHCWVHARREFVACEEAYPEASRWILARIAELYAIDAEAPKGAAGDAERGRLRREKSAPVLEQIVGWVYQTALTVPAESQLRKAIGYLVGRWKGLVRFVEDARLPLDNNGVERDARKPALGRKNHYGSRTRRGTEVSAQMYTLVETALLSGLDPKTYLHFAALRALRGRSIVLPHELTEALLREETGLSAEQAQRAWLGGRTEPAAPVGA